MAVKQREWVASEWTRPGVELWRRPGDFYELNNLRPNATRCELRRGFGWTFSEFPVGFTLPMMGGSFYDLANDRRVFIGTNAAVHVAAAYADSSWSWTGPTELVAADSDLHAYDGRNCCLWGGDLYLLTGTDIYRRASYDGAMVNLYNAGASRILCPYGDRMYSADAAGLIVRLNDADDGFDSFFDPVGQLDVVFMAGFRQALHIWVRGYDSSFYIYRLPDHSASTLHQVACLGAVKADLTTLGCPFAVFEGDVYFTAGRHVELDGSESLDVYRYNGSMIEKLSVVPAFASVFDLHYLGVWRGELMLMTLAVNSDREHEVYMMVGDRFCKVSSKTEYAYGHANSIANVLVMAGKDVAKDGIWYTSDSALLDGYLITSWLDMDYPGRLKRLLRLTVLLDGAAADFDVIIKYRCDDEAGWTTAVTSDDTRRVTVDIITEVRFYTLQLRIDLDDDTGNDEDIGIEAVSVVYSIPN